MAATFYLAGNDESQSFQIDLSDVTDLEALRIKAAGEFHVVDPSGIAFQVKDIPVNDLEEIRSTEEAVGITIDGHTVREVPGPKGLPFVGQVVPRSTHRSATDCATVITSRSSQTTLAITSDCSIAMGLSSGPHHWERPCLRSTTQS